MIFGRILLQDFVSDINLLHSHDFLRALFMNKFYDLIDADLHLSIVNWYKVKRIIA